MKKALKFVGITLLAIVGLVVLLVLTLPLWLGPVARPIANSTVSDLTGAKFHLGELGLNPYGGTLHVGDMQLSNPTNGNFKADENCVELGKLDVDVDMSTLGNKKIVITSVVLDGLTIRTTMAGGNFLQIADNAKAASGEGEVEAVEKEDAKTEEPETDETHVQIDKLVLSGIVIKYGAVPLPVPTLTIEGIGADTEEGATIGDAFAAIKTKVLAAAGAIGGKLGDLGKGAADLIGDGAGKAADALGGQAGAAVDALGDGASKATDAISGGAGAAVDAVKGLFK